MAHRLLTPAGRKLYALRKQTPEPVFGSIKSATQGYFEVTARDGDSEGGWGASDTPYKKVRVVTTVEYYLD